MLFHVLQLEEGKITKPQVLGTSRLTAVLTGEQERNDTP